MKDPIKINEKKLYEMFGNNVLSLGKILHKVNKAAIKNNPDLENITITTPVLFGEKKEHALVIMHSLEKDELVLYEIFLYENVESTEDLILDRFNKYQKIKGSVNRFISHNNIK